MENRLAFHYDINSHNLDNAHILPIEIDKINIIVLEEIIAHIIKENRNIDIQIFSCVDEEGSYLKNIALFVGIVAGGFTIMDTGFFKGLTGTTGEELGVCLSTNIKRLFETESEELRNDYDDDVLKSKNKFVEELIKNKYINGVSYNRSYDFISKKTLKEKHIIEFLEIEKSIYILGKIEVTAPVYKSKAGKNVNGRELLKY